MKKNINSKSKKSIRTTHIVITAFYINVDGIDRQDVSTYMETVKNRLKKDRGPSPINEINYFIPVIKQNSKIEILAKIKL